MTIELSDVEVEAVKRAVIYTQTANPWTVANATSPPGDDKWKGAIEWGHRIKQDGIVMGGLRARLGV